MTVLIVYKGIVTSITATLTELGSLRNSSLFKGSTNCLQLQRAELIEGLGL